ncbi:MAG TPA: hypothetical protein VN207_10310 [Ktedonobacteraceae bacterium]|nr:hypothetical protein [Ktedonobacteraceae bacterium]
MDKNKGYDALLLIILLPCITFILAITLLGIVKPIMEGLGSSIYHRDHQITFPLVPRAPIPVPSQGSSSFIIKNELVLIR